MVENRGREELDDDLFDEDDEDYQKDMYLTFFLADEEYALEVRYVTEIIRILKITAVPDMDDFVKGVINLRGKIIPIIDVRARFKMETVEYGDRTCIIVVNYDGISIGLVVDEVSEVTNISEENIEPAPNTKKNDKSHFIKGIGKIDDEIKIILDVSKLLYEDEINKIKDTAADSALEES